VAWTWTGIDTLLLASIASEPLRVGSPELDEQAARTTGTRAMSLRCDFMGHL